MNESEKVRLMRCLEKVSGIKTELEIMADEHPQDDAIILELHTLLGDAGRRLMDVRKRMLGRGGNVNKDRACVHALMMIREQLELMPFTGYPQIDAALSTLADEVGNARSLLISIIEDEG